MPDRRPHFHSTRAVVMALLPCGPCSIHGNPIWRGFHGRELDRIKGLLGGRAAEDLELGEVSTGAENDLQHATAVACQMVAMSGVRQGIDD
jgi:Peptidase family M41